MSAVPSIAQMFLQVKSLRDFLGLTLDARTALHWSKGKMLTWNATVTQFCQFQCTLYTPGAAAKTLKTM